MAGKRRITAGPLMPLIALLLPAYLLAGCGRAAPRVRMVAVPEVAGMTAEEAEAALVGAGLEMGTVSEAHTDAVTAGKVISSNPAAGEEIEEGSRVDLVISKGPEWVVLIDLVGKAESEAVSALQAQGFQVSVERAYHESLASGLVCSMDPDPGTALARGTTVVLTVSLGSAYVTCRTCGGRGKITTSVDCPECGGTGICYT